MTLSSVSGWKSRGCEVKNLASGEFHTEYASVYYFPSFTFCLKSHLCRDSLAPIYIPGARICVQCPQECSRLLPEAEVEGLVRRFRIGQKCHGRATVVEKPLTSNEAGGRGQCGCERGLTFRPLR